MTLEEFEPAFKMFVASFGRANTPERTTVFFEALRYYEAAEVATVMKELTFTWEHLPTVSELLHEIRTRRKQRTYECEYCAGSGWEIVYSEFEYAPGKERALRKGPLVSRETYEAEPLKFNQFAARCRCRPAEVKA